MAAAPPPLTIDDVRRILGSSLPVVTDEGERRLPGIRVRVEAFNAVVTDEINGWIGGTIEPGDAIQAIKLSLLNQFRENIVQAADVPENIASLDTALAQLTEPEQVLFLVGGVIASLDRAGIGYTQTTNNSILRIFVNKATRVVVGILRVFSGLISRMGDAARAVANLASAVFTFLITPRVPDAPKTIKQVVEEWITDKSDEELNFNDIRIGLLPLFKYKPSPDILRSGINATQIRAYTESGNREVSSRVLLSIAATIFEKRIDDLRIAGENTGRVDKQTEISIICSNLLEQFIAACIASSEHDSIRSAVYTAAATRLGARPVRERSGVSIGDRELAPLRSYSDIVSVVPLVRRCATIIRTDEGAGNYFGATILNSSIISLLDSLQGGTDDNRINILSSLLNPNTVGRRDLIATARDAYAAFLLSDVPAAAVAPVEQTIEDILRERRAAQVAARRAAQIAQAAAEAVAVEEAAVAALPAAAAGAIMNAPVASSAAASGGAATGGASARPPVEQSLEEVIDNLAAPNTVAEPAAKRARVDPSAAATGGASAAPARPPPLSRSPSSAAGASSSKAPAPTNLNVGGAVTAIQGMLAQAAAPPSRTPSGLGTRQGSAAAAASSRTSILAGLNPPAAAGGAPARTTLPPVPETAGNANDTSHGSKTVTGKRKPSERPPHINNSDNDDQGGGARRTRRRRHRTTHRRRPQQRRRHHRMSRRHRVSRRQRRS